jgi:hypothetical protein
MSKISFENLLSINPHSTDIDDIEMSGECLVALFKDMNIRSNKLVLRFLGEQGTYKEMFLTINDNIPRGIALYDYGNYGENTKEIVLPI